MSNTNRTNKNGEKTDAPAGQVVPASLVARRPTERGVSRDGAPRFMSLGGPQAKRGKKTRVYLEQGKQNKNVCFGEYVNDNFV